MPDDSFPPSADGATAVGRRILVVAYSRTGTTRRVASEIARACGADLETIIDRRNRTGWLGWLRCGFEAVMHSTPPIRDSRHPPDRYALVVIGTPVWAGAPASPVRSWLRRHRLQVGRVAFFCTAEGDGNGPVFQALAELCGQPPVATLSLPAERIAQRTHRRRVDTFATRVLEAAASARPPVRAAGRQAA